MRDLYVGERLPELRLTVELGAMKVFSVLMADPNPIHFDPAHTAALGLGDRPVNQGTLTLSYPVDALLAVLDDPARIRRVRCRFAGSVVADDVVTAGGEVTARHPTGATVSIWLDVEGRGRVLTGEVDVDLS
ncbi:MaoC family dehydratase [Nakamurella endophytica]|uniref:MaoC-like domain-containing protein n=1 Tax=Nakamurella endophytica TaxID=1748367 RepID=A0A917WCL2_9ACTN|nr:MaoC family dehydratase [Nakamurella endophytica]GGL94650.1 hypothetical protein GCM10011594_13080 [Nakamurella endophytica]